MRWRFNQGQRTIRFAGPRRRNIALPSRLSVRDRSTRERSPFTVCCSEGIKETRRFRMYTVDSGSKWIPTNGRLGRESEIATKTKCIAPS